MDLWVLGQHKQWLSKAGAAHNFAAYTNTFMHCISSPIATAPTPTSPCFVCPSLTTDVALITSLRDGMNLVSYEYVACQADNAGVLVLSEFAGAAQSLGAGGWLGVCVHTPRNTAG